MGSLVVKLADASRSLDSLLLRAILQNKANNGQQQETCGKKALDAGAPYERDDRANCHDSEEARARAHSESGRQEGDKVDDNGPTCDAVTNRNPTLRCKLERAALRFGVWLHWGHSKVFVLGRR